MQALKHKVSSRNAKAKKGCADWVQAPRRCLIQRCWVFMATVIGGVEYEKVDSGLTFREAPRSVQDWQPPDPTSAEQAAEVVLYRPDDPMELRPYQIPKPGGHERMRSYPSCSCHLLRASLSGLSVVLSADPKVALITANCWLPMVSLASTMAPVATMT